MGVVKGQRELPQSHRTVVGGFCVHSQCHSLPKQLKLGNFVPHPGGRHLPGHQQTPVVQHRHGNDKQPTVVPVPSWVQHKEFKLLSENTDKNQA